MSLTRPVRTLRGWARNPRLPLHTVRMRLTLLYGALFLLSGAALLAVAYTLTWNATSPPVDKVLINEARLAVSPQAMRELKLRDAVIASQHATMMHQLLASCAIALAITAVLSIALGWLVAGRVLRPLRGMTAATQRISEQNLYQRLAVAGPDDDLKRLGDTIDGLLARLEGAFDAQRRFVANASHELRTPLTMMRTALDVATCKPHPTGQDVTILAAKMRRGLDMADGLLEGFLTLARAQNGSFKGGVTVSLDQLASAALAERGEAIAAMELTVDHAAQEAAVQGSEILLTRMVENVIDNAVRHNEPGGWIRVATEADCAQARLMVETGGRILDDREIRELARPFRRLAPDRTGSDNGTGLGLSIVAAVAATHHGTLDLHARPQGGLRVVITLPASAPAAMAGLPS